MSTIILSAFCIEAFLNHIGSELLPYWDDEIKKGLNTQNKLKIICHHLGLTPDISRRPFQSIKLIMRYRNILAHGTSEKISSRGVQVVQNGKRVRYPDTWWEEHSKLMFARRWLVDTEKMITTMYKQAGKGEIPFGILGVGTHLGTII